MKLHLTVVVVLFLLPLAAHAGHAAPSYIDPGQSADGRFVVRAEKVGSAAGPLRWQFTWQDTKTGERRVLDLKGVSTGESYAHIFVAPDGETFAVWNPLMYHVSSGKTKRIAADVDRTTPEWRTREEFTKRLLVYRKTGDLVQELGVNDFLKPEEWAGTLAVFERIEWLKEYDGMAFKKTPRAGYSMYRVSPDYSVLEVATKGTKGQPGRVIRVALTTGKVLDPKDWSTESARVPGRPFVGPADVSNLAVDVKEKYRPSLDPVRSEGKFPQ